MTTSIPSDIKRTKMGGLSGHQIRTKISALILRHDAFDCAQPR